MTNTWLIRGGTIISETGASQGDLLVEGETVKAQGSPGAFDHLVAGSQIVDATGKLVLPGLIDVHLHLNSPFMGTISAHGYDNGTVAAAFGGVTTIIDFSTQPKGGSLLKNLEQKEEEARGKTLLDWSMSGILMDASPKTLAEIPLLIQEGIPTYKCFTTYKHSERLMDDESMLKILDVTAANGGMLMVHCEHDAIMARRIERALQAQQYAPIYHAHTRPSTAENMAIQRVIDLMREAPAQVYIVHTSTAESAQIIQRARLEGLPIHSETCTHYLALTEEKLLEPNGQLFICSPPLRAQRDVEALWNALNVGSIEVVSSDDAGVLPEDNWRLGAGRFDKVPSGLSGIEPRLAILFTEGVSRGRISLSRLVSLTSTTPARLFGMYPQKGHLGVGADADVVIYDPQPQWTMTAASLHMNTSFCCFEGWQIQGKVVSVMSRGEFIIRDGSLVGKPGRGKRVFRQLAG